jgi:hypothetical protein
MIRDISIQNSYLVTKKTVLEDELKKHIHKLKKAKIELALTEERKVESELSLKNEIKFLIEKLLRVKNKLAKQKKKEKDTKEKTSGDDRDNERKRAELCLATLGLRIDKEMSEEPEEEENNTDTTDISKGNHTQKY